MLADDWAMINDSHEAAGKSSRVQQALASTMLNLQRHEWRKATVAKDDPEGLSKK